MSSLAAGIFASYFGRKTAIWSACVLNAVACTILVATTSKGAIYFGRLLLGFSNGFLVTFSNIYVSEVAPAYLRGVLVALFGPWVSIGAILGAAIDNATKTRLDKSCYQIPTGCLYIVPVLLSVGLCFVPESPRYLLLKGHEAKAKQSLFRVRGELFHQGEALEVEWAQMLRGIEEEKVGMHRMDWTEMFKGKSLYRRVHGIAS